MTNRNYVWLSVSKLFFGAASIAGIVQDFLIGASDGIPYAWIVFLIATLIASTARAVPPLSKALGDRFPDYWFFPVFIFLIATTVGTMIFGYESRKEWQENGGESGLLISESKQILQKLGFIQDEIETISESVSHTEEITTEIYSTEVEMMSYLNLMSNADHNHKMESVLESYYKRAGITPNYTMNNGHLFGYLATFKQESSQSPLWVNAIVNDSVSKESMERFLKFFLDNGISEQKEFRTKSLPAIKADIDQNPKGLCEYHILNTNTMKHDCLALGFSRWFKTIKTTGGVGPITVAVVNGKHEKLRSLLKMGFDPNSADDAGYRAIDYAFLKNDDDAINMLATFSARPDSFTTGLVIMALASKAVTPKFDNPFLFQNVNARKLDILPSLDTTQKRAITQAIRDKKVQLEDSIAARKSEIRNDSNKIYGNSEESRRSYEEAIILSDIEIKEDLEKLNSLSSINELAKSK